MRLLTRLSLIFIVAVFAIGCSSVSNNPLAPDGTRDAEPAQQANAHHLWGLWQFMINPELATVEFAPVRAAELHINAVTFLEPPANVNISIEGPPEFAGGNVTLNIGITHPFTGLDKFTGFDVKGILIGHGSIQVHDIPALFFADDTQLRLLNPDGHTRWWNPEEFPGGTVDHQGYKDGLLGAPDSVAEFTGTLNPYKYYCDFLGAEDDLATLPVDNRGYFSAGAKNVRQFVIDFTPSGLVFNYAVDANWLPPSGPVVPDDFPPGANQPEPYRIELTEITNTLVYNTTSQEASGQFVIDVDIYDWNGAGQDIACAYSTNGELSGICSFFPSGGGEGYSTYQIDTGPGVMTSADDILLWIAVECQDPMNYNGFLPWEVQGTYFPYIVTVAEES